MIVSAGNVSAPRASDRGIGAPPCNTEEKICSSVDGMRWSAPCRLHLRNHHDGRYGPPSPACSCHFSGIVPRLDFGPDMRNTQKLTQLAVMMAITLQTSFLLRLSARCSST